MSLTRQEKDKIIELINAGKPLPAVYKSKLFQKDDTEFIEATKDYRLVYKGKARKEDIIAQTPAAPFQLIRTFNSDNPFNDNWRNMLIFGDNLLALKTLYDDQRGQNIYKTKNRIKLIYIDPPFATKQDFMKDREKAYRDKIIGAQFIEFLRKRLILLREILADDGSIYVHLDWKKGHYIKAIMDEVFGEHNFVNEITWKGADAHNDSTRLGIVDNHIFWYSKSKDYIFESVYLKYSKSYLDQFYNNIEEESKRRYRLDHFTKPKGSIGYFYEYKGCQPPPNGWRCPIATMKKWDEKGVLVVRGAKIYKKRYLDEQPGKQVTTVWDDITGQIKGEGLEYPTQKPERLLERIVNLSTKDEKDIVVDTFAGSGTTLSVAEKLGRRWIGIDCGKLAIYTVQNRMLNLTTQIGSAKNDERRDYERVKDFEEHSRSNSRALLFIYEKAKKGDLAITDSFLKNLAALIDENLSGGKDEEFSLICPEEKLQLSELEAVDAEEDSAGEKIVQVGRVKFLISLIQPKEKTEKEKPLQAKEFTLYHAGIYDSKKILEMPWEQYKPFVIQLFSLRSEPHKIHGFEADGYIGVHSAYIWDYPDQKNLTLDREYVRTLHHVLGGRAGDKFYVIAPIVSMGFMEDEVVVGNTTYVFLKVPLSVLMALIERGDPGSIKQPASENDVNEVIDAVGFDFISQPEVKAGYHRRSPVEKNLFNAKKKDYSIEITHFKSNTLVYDPEDFENFETLSMVLVDTNYNEDWFNLDKVFWADKILNGEKTRAVIRMPEDDFIGKKMMVIFIDKYGNEYKVIKTKKDFK